jgi:hypothetical protein
MGSTIWLEVPSDQENKAPGLIAVDAGPGVKEQVIAKLGLQGASVKEISQERALEIFKMQHIADGMSEEDAKAAALEDLEEWES